MSSTANTTPKEPAARGLLNVVGRAAHPVVPVLLLVALGQGALNEGGGRADEGQQPHPEHRAVAPMTVAAMMALATPAMCPCPPGRRWRSSGPGRRRCPCRPFSSPPAPAGLGEQPELHPAGAHGEVEPRKNQQGDENVGIQKVAGVAQSAPKLIMRRYSSLFISLLFTILCLALFENSQHAQSPGLCPLDGPILEIRQDSCEKIACQRAKFLAAGHIAIFQTRPRVSPHLQGYIQQGTRPST